MPLTALAVLSLFQPAGTGIWCQYQAPGRSGERSSEPVARVAEAALPEREHLRGPHREHVRRPLVVVQDAVAGLEPPPSVPLPAPRLGQAFEHLAVGDPHGVAFD